MEFLLLEPYLIAQPAIDRGAMDSEAARRFGYVVMASVENRLQRDDRTIAGIAA